MKRIAILASGSGSNAEKIIQHFKDSGKARIVIIGSNKKDAFVLERAKKHNIPYWDFSKKELEQGAVRDRLIDLEVDLVVLAGFLLMIPENLLVGFPNKIINIHPALLPKYGGKGMYGEHVHQAVKDNKEVETGITIHYVNDRYDEGRIIFQKSVPIEDSDNVPDIAKKVQVLEHKYFPKVIESLL